MTKGTSRGIRNTAESFVNEIDQMEGHYLVGRDKELQLFREQLVEMRVRGRVLNLYGTGGVGKSYLLDEFRRIADQEKTRFVLLDSRDFPHNPQDFCLQLLRLLRFNVSKDEQSGNLIRLLELCQEAIQQEIEQDGMIIALDTFEEFGDFEYWLREEFLTQLHSKALIVISGRYPIQGVWLSSPARRQYNTAAVLGLFYRYAGAEIEGMEGVERDEGGVFREDDRYSRLL